MFTGLVQDLGRIVSIENHDGGLQRMTVQGRLKPEDLTLGASVSHSGVCLTVVATDLSGEMPTWVVEAVPETLAKTNLGKLVEGSAVNLEPSLRLGDELGGHLVFGHVDGLGEISSVEKEGEGFRVSVTAPEQLRPLIAEKGSVCVDGISLTVARVTDEGFEIAVIPHTWEVTTLGHCNVGDKVNLEADMLARYVARQMEFR
tara:strand:- start:34258 stop:34863 length:606 start_codon:yes stop_codon:yes gene_type:complete